MGKHEREDVYIAEKILNNLLNGEKVDNSRRQHKLFDCATALANRIRTDFPNIRKSHHIGNIYGGSIGNIKLILATGEEIYLELKFLVSGLGTRASMGQDTLTKFHLFKGESVLSWSDFRKSKKHDRWVLEELDKYGNYPEWIQNMRGKGAIYEKAGCLKEVIGASGNTMPIVEEVLNSRSSSTKEKLAAEIIKNIMEKDRNEKIEYIYYLTTLDQNHENIKKFLFLILAGVHTYESLTALWNINLPQIIETLRHGYFVYYVYKGTLRTEVEDYSRKLKNLLDKEIYILFRENQTNVLLSFMNDKRNEILILRIVFHWKNKFQGIETPCLNIFDERYLTEDII